MAWEAGTQGRNTKEGPDRLGRRDKEDLNKRRNEWKGVRAIVLDHQRWKALCEPSTHIRRRGSAKWSNKDTKNNKQEKTQDKIIQQSSFD